MSPIDDQTIPADATLLRVLLKNPNWTVNDEGRLRPASLAFFSTTQEISYFIEEPGVTAEVCRIFPDHKIARVPASVIRENGLAIERRPGECPPDFQCNHDCHVIAGPAAEITRKEYERRARRIAKHPQVAVIEPGAPQADPQI